MIHSQQIITYPINYITSSTSLTISMCKATSTISYNKYILTTLIGTSNQSLISTTLIFNFDTVQTQDVAHEHLRVQVDCFQVNWLNFKKCSCEFQLITTFNSSIWTCHMSIVSYTVYFTRVLVLKYSSATTCTHMSPSPRTWEVPHINTGILLMFRWTIFKKLVYMTENRWLNMDYISIWS